MAVEKPRRRPPHSTARHGPRTPVPTAADPNSNLPVHPSAAVLRAAPGFRLLRSAAEGGHGTPPWPALPRGHRASTLAPLLRTPWAIKMCRPSSTRARHQAKSGHRRRCASTALQAFFFRAVWSVFHHSRVHTLVLKFVPCLRILRVEARDVVQCSAPSWTSRPRLKSPGGQSKR